MSSEPHPDLLASLKADEIVRATALTTVGIVAVTDQRLLVSSGQRVALSVRFEQLRRIEFDVDKDGPATLVIVPEQPRHEPQVLTIPGDQVAAAADLLVLVAGRLGRRTDA